jgi:hypothetical protein
VLALAEGHGGDALELLGVVPEAADMAPGDLIGRDTEVIVAPLLDSRMHGFDLGFPGENGGTRNIVRLGNLVLVPGPNLRKSDYKLDGNMNALGAIKSKSKRRSESDS